MDTLNEFIKNDKSGADYLKYCVNSLTSADQELAKKYLKFQPKADK